MAPALGNPAQGFEHMETTWFWRLAGERSGQESYVVRNGEFEDHS